MIRGRAEKRTDPAVVEADAKFGDVACPHWLYLPKGWDKCAYCGGLPPVVIRHGQKPGVYLKDVIARIQDEEEVYSPFRTVNS